MKLKRFICLCLLSLLMLSAVSCNGNNDGEADTTDTDAPKDERLYIVEGGASVDIVYSDDATADDLTLVNDISLSIERITGVRPASSVEKPISAPEKVEIVVGETSYEESKQIYSELRYGEGIVRAVGKKIVIAGYDLSSYKKATNELLSYLNDSKDENGSYSVPADISVSAVGDAALASLPVMAEKAMTLTDTGDECRMLTFKNTTVAEFNGYLAELGDAGFAKYAKNPIENNLYYTYRNDAYIVTAIHTGHDSTAKVLIEPKTKSALPKPESENVYTEICDTTVTQVGVYYDPNKEENEAKGEMQDIAGMCYVIRLADGSFIVEDGGYSSETDVYADNLYKVLKKQAHDAGREDIVIAAWVFSHGDGDHVNFFPAFARKYADKVTVERFIVNFASAEQFPPNGVTTYTTTMVNIQKFKGAEVVKAHPGQVFYLRNARLEILYTLDVKADATLKDYNNSSIVYKLTLEDLDVMMFGDYSEFGHSMLKLYTAKTLKSDIMQVAHHGIYGMDSAMYTQVAPEYALWPVSAMHISRYEGVMLLVQELDKEKQNEYIINEMDQNKVFVAGTTVTVLTLKNGSVASSTVYDNVSAYIGEAG